MHRLRRLAATLPTGWACFYCGNRTYVQLPPDHPLRATREHVVPKSAGGRGLAGNIVIACRRCNATAGRWVDPWLAALHRGRTTP